VFLAELAQCFLSGRQATVARERGGGVGGVFLFPPAEHIDIDAQVPGSFRHAVALVRNEADGFLLKLCCIGLAFLCHVWTPPAVLIPRLFQCPLLSDHNIASQSMRTTCGRICVTRYAGEEHSDGSKTGFRRMGLRKSGIATETTRYERLRWRGVRYMGFSIRNRRGTHTPP